MHRFSAFLLPLFLLLPLSVGAEVLKGVDDPFLNALSVHGIRPGVSRARVQALLGAPAHESDDSFLLVHLPGRGSIATYGSHAPAPEGSTTVHFDDADVARIVEGDALEQEGRALLGRGATVLEAQEALGPPDEYVVRHGKGIETLYYHRHALHLIALGGRVFSVSIDPLLRERYSGRRRLSEARRQFDRLGERFLDVALLGSTEELEIALAELERVGLTSSERRALDVPRALHRLARAHQSGVEDVEAHERLAELLPASRSLETFEAASEICFRAGHFPGALTWLDLRDRLLTPPGKERPSWLSGDRARLYEREAERLLDESAKASAEARRLRNEAFSAGSGPKATP